MDRGHSRRSQLAPVHAIFQDEAVGGGQQGAVSRAAWRPR